MGSWTANNLSGSSVYANLDGNNALFAGTGSYDLIAGFERYAMLAGGFDISFNYSIGRTGSTTERRNFLTGLDASGSTVFQILLSGSNLDDCNKTLYWVTSSGFELLATGIARNTTPDFLDSAMGLIELNVDANGLSLSRNGVELLSDAALFGPNDGTLASLRFEGDSTFYDNLSVVSNGPGESPYERWEATFGLIQGQDGDDDNDGLSNLYEFGSGGDPTDVADAGYPLRIDLNDTNIEITHLWRPGVAYTLESSSDIEANDWSPLEAPPVSLESLGEDSALLKSLVPLPENEPLFIQLKMELE
ncbi:MAG: hypothetical protein P8L49_04230 [Opitutaceae bacterium]|nr:hypothetical protein [Opitutaceae bacterium]